ncbi:MAG: hypothetical protein HY548_01595, partial [Elusimicrobia bacterium]|nr:hypothetical protein [Elusimicrobiota bacterium]
AVQQNGRGESLTWEGEIVGDEMTGVVTQVLYDGTTGKTKWRAEKIK